MATVKDLARVIRGSNVVDHAVVDGWATVEASTVANSAQVHDSAHVYDSAILSETDVRAAGKNESGVTFTMPITDG
jgi:ADP-glucose pyrophosphorylase